MSTPVDPLGPWRHVSVQGPDAYWIANGEAHVDAYNKYLATNPDPESSEFKKAAAKYDLVATAYAEARARYDRTTANECSMVRKARRRSNLSLSRLSAHTNISVPRLMAYEYATIPRPATLTRILEACHTSIAELMAL